MRRAFAWAPAMLGLLLLVGAGVAGLGLRYLRGTQFPHGSSHRSDGKGLRALYLLLEETGHRPRRLTRAEPPAGVLLVMAEPPAVASPGRDEAIVRWISEGGRLLLILPRAKSPEEPEAELTGGEATEPREPPKPPLAERLGLRANPGEVWAGALDESPFYELDFEEERAAQSFSHRPQNAEVLLGGPTAPVLVSFRMGKGGVTALADPGFLDNEGLGRADRLPLALALTVESGRPIVFDEFSHGVGERAGLAYVLARYGLLPSAFAALAFLALLAWRTGSPESPTRDAETVPVRTRDSLVDARALLYSRALRPRDAVELVERDLRYNASTALGATRLLSWEELDERVRDRKPTLLGRFRALRNQTKAHEARPPARLSEVVPFAKSAAHLLEEMR